MSDSKPGSDLPKMVPDRDQIRSRKATASSSPSPRSTPSPSHSEPPNGGGRVPVLLWVLVLLLAAALAGLGLMTYSQQQSLAMFDERLQLADDRIVTMQRFMTETDESVVMNETAINNQFRAIKAETDMQMSEIRKLWDVANKRNREWIESNQQSIAQLQSNLQAQTQASEQALARLTSKTAEQAQSSEALRQQIAAVQAELSETAGQFATLQDNLDSLDPATLEERLLSLTLTQENLLVEQGTVSMNQQLLEERVAELNDVLRSIDAGRLEANRRLVAVSDRVQALEDRLPPTSGAQ
jgi:chromosome segregation ATPase